MDKAKGVIHLNVGGILYTTTQSTLTRYPNSMLGAMFDHGCNGTMTTTKDENGHCFIDRDGSIFRYILNFLRSDRLNLPSDFEQLDLLQTEADFYQIQPLIHATVELRAKKPAIDQCHLLEVIEIRTGSTATMPTNNSRKKTVLSGRKDVILSLPIETHVAEGSMEKLLQTPDSEFVELELFGTAGNIRLRLAEYLKNSGWDLLNSDLTSSSGYDSKSLVSSLIIEHSYRDRWSRSIGKS